MRLTIDKLYGEIVVLMTYCATGNVEYLSSTECANRFKNILETVKEYKNIEEELGIDLITLFKALNSPIYIKENYDGTIVDETLWCSNCIICGFGNPIIKVGEYGVYPNDYGKTWALTKEELQDENHK